MINLAILGKRLKEARTNRGITQETAAEAIGVPRTALVHIEAGNRSVSTLELAELASLYGRPISAFLADGEDQDEDFLVALHRLSPEIKNREAVQREVLRCVELCREGFHLESLLKRKLRLGPPAYDLPPPSNFAEAIEQGEAIADEERNRVGLAHSSIPDMADLLSTQAIWACGVELPDQMSGLFLHQRSIGFVVLVNYHHRRGRKRFSYAHEYAHALLDRKQGMTVTTKSNSNELMEKRANAFAASFLVPKMGVELLLSTLEKGALSRRTYHVYDVATEEAIEAERRVRASSQEITFRDAALLAAHFGVSYQVAVYRLSDLGLVNRDQLKSLLEHQDSARNYLRIIGKLDHIAGGPRESDRELVNQIVPLALEAYQREEISRGKLFELSKKLDLKGSELAALA
jgi:Zn-dependent peptidase ImmA (M78 family)/transcriptional regulator with XRE-family HTH domain